MLEAERTREERKRQAKCVVENWLNSHRQATMWSGTKGVQRPFHLYRSIATASIFEHRTIFCKNTLDLQGNGNLFMWAHTLTFIHYCFIVHVYAFVSWMCICGSRGDLAWIRPDSNPSWFVNVVVRAKPSQAEPREMLSLTSQTLI